MFYSHFKVQGVIIRCLKFRYPQFYILHRASRYRLHFKFIKSLFLLKFGQFDAACNSRQAKGWSDLQFAVIFFPQILRKASVPVIRGPGCHAGHYYGARHSVVRLRPMLGQHSTRPGDECPLWPQLYLGTPSGNMCHPRALTRPSLAHQVTADTKWA